MNINTEKPDIVAQWATLPEDQRKLHKNEYRNAMAGADLIKLWSELKPIEQDALYGMYRDQCAKQRKLFAKKQKNTDTPVKTDTFNQRFILNVMNRFAPKGYKFVIIGPERKIALYNAEIMGDQEPRGAFVSDISFDLVEGVYGSLFKQDGTTTYDESIFWRMRTFLADKPYRTTKEKHAKYIKTIDSLSGLKMLTTEFLHNKQAPLPLFTKNNAIIVQGIMDDGKPAPEYLQKRMHDIANFIVWWTFRRAMRTVRAAKLLKHRKAYKRKMNQLKVSPGTRSEYTQWRDKIDLKNTTHMRNRLYSLRYDMLPAAVNNKDDEQIQTIKKEIGRLEKYLGSDYKTPMKPARNLLKNTFVVKQKQKSEPNTNKPVIKTVKRDFSKNMPAIKQFWLLISARKNTTKTK
ncbi:MAG: hypothetical protein J6L70_03090 [Alphaproteobacteria bacterium]|nr:hypothetical protein [Alphaproteobacteria bacterium]